jgi:hypothetical protein
VTRQKLISNNLSSNNLSSGGTIKGGGHHGGIASMIVGDPNPSQSEPGHTIIDQSESRPNQSPWSPFATLQQLPFRAATSVPNSIGAV